MQIEEISRAGAIRLCRRRRGRQTHIPLYVLVREPEGRIVAEYRRIDRARRALAAVGGPQIGGPYEPETED